MSSFISFECTVARPYAGAGFAVMKPDARPENNEESLIFGEDNNGFYIDVFIDTENIRRLLLTPAEMDRLKVCLDRLTVR